VAAREVEFALVVETKSGIVAVPPMAAMVALVVELTRLKSRTAPPTFTGTASADWEPLVDGRLTAVGIACGHSELLDPAVLEQLGPLITEAL